MKQQPSSLMQTQTDSPQENVLSAPVDEQPVAILLNVPESYTFECKRVGKVDKLLESIVAFSRFVGK